MRCIAELIAAIRERRQRIDFNHAHGDQETRDRLSFTITIAEAEALANAVEELRHLDRFAAMGSVTIGEFRMSKDQDNRLWIMIAGDGEGGVFPESELAKVLRQYYAERF